MKQIPLLRQHQMLPLGRAGPNKSLACRSAAATRGEGGGNERASAGELARLDSRLLEEEEEREYQATLESSRLAREAEELR